MPAGCDGSVPLTSENRDNDTMTASDTTVQNVPTTNDGDHERFAHYVKKGDIVRSNVEGVEVVALCGKKWIPNRDPSRYPVCPACKEIMAALKGQA